MRRLKWMTVLTTLLLSLFALACCGDEKKPQTEVKAESLQTEYGEYETFVGGFEYDSVTLIVGYSDGATKELPLTAEMLSEEDLAKQNELGEHTLTVTYGNLSCSFTLSVVEDTSALIEFLDRETVYDGKAKFLSVINLPVGATVAYENNGVIGAGEYEVKALITLPGGKTMEKTAMLTVLKASLTVKAETAKTFVGYEPEFSCELVGLAETDDETALTTLPRLVEGEQVNAIGEYKDYVRFEGAEAKNYEITYRFADLFILALPELEEVDGKRYLTLGEYPQTVVSDVQTVEKLDAGIENGLLAANRKGYYELDGKLYAKMVSNHYVNGESYAKFTNGETIVFGKTYYFEVEPIRWQALSTSNGVSLISEKLLDTEPFWDIENAVVIDGVTYNPNDYSQSAIRKWLNGDFRNLAFGTHERKIMNKVTVTNGASDSLYPNYPCENTEDFVYLPSYAEITNGAFGFSTNADRMALTTDYTRATGTYMRPALAAEPEQIGYGTYYLRSAGYSGIREVTVVDTFGDPTKEKQSGSFIVCIRPVINVTLAA